MYGNIGGGNRLDFTCIGPAVNLAARHREGRGAARPVDRGVGGIRRASPARVHPARRVRRGGLRRAAGGVRLDRLMRNDGASPIMSDDDYHPFIPNPPNAKIAGPTARAHAEARTAQPARQGAVRQVGADVQRAVPRHHHRRQRHPRSLRAAAGGRADAGDDRGGQRAAGHDVAGAEESRRAFRPAPTCGGTGRTPSSMSSTTACASTRSASRCATRCWRCCAPA